MKIKAAGLKISNHNRREEDGRVGSKVSAGGRHFYPFQGSHLRRLFYASEHQDLPTSASA